MHHLNFVVVDLDNITWDVHLCVYGDDCFVDVVRGVFEQVLYTPIWHLSYLKSTFYQYCHTVGSYIGVLPKIEYPHGDDNVPIAVKFDDTNSLIARFSRI